MGSVHLVFYINGMLARRGESGKARGRGCWRGGRGVCTLAIVQE